MIGSRFLFSPKIRGAATFDFCNIIEAKRTLVDRPPQRIYDGVDAPRRHRCAKVEVLSTT